LGVPTVADRVAQMVVKKIVEREVEPIFLPDSYAGDDKRSAWSFVAGVIAGSVLMAFVGGNGSSDPRQVLSDDKAWPPELPSDQDEALYDLCLANGGTKLSCDAQQGVILAPRLVRGFSFVKIDSAAME
jgi:hypothetical protein